MVTGEKTAARHAKPKAEAVAGWASARGCAGVVGHSTAGTALTTVAASLALGLVCLVVGKALKIGELRRVPGFRRHRAPASP